MESSSFLDQKLHIGLYGNITRQNSNKKAKSFHAKITQIWPEKTYISILQLLSHSLTFFLEKNKALRSTTSILSQQPKPTSYNTAVFMENLNSTNFVDFGKR